MRLSRPCYDKPHHCPGWAGGGMRYSKVDRCGLVPAAGVVMVRGDRNRGPGMEPWRFGRCDTCRTITWPYITRWLDPTWTVEWAKTRIELRHGA